tara:strand:- start:181 stop:609 length:429 start_codon:yes stop_codon:yes gene_type:complete
MFLKGIKMEWLIVAIAFVVGSGAGTGITWSIMKNKKPKVQIVETNKVVEKMVEVDNSLTDQDLLKIPCSKEYMEKNGEGLCREMFCRMNTRSGNQSNAATAKECEAIGNILNKKMILKKCEDLAKGDATKKKECIEFFDRRL